MHDPKVYIAQVRDVSFGEGVTLVEPCNLYECSIGKGAFIGPFVEIQKGVVVGELVSIGSECFIGHGVMFINDLFSDGGPARGDQSKWRSTKIGDAVSIGSNATILPVSICDHVVIGAGSVVTKDIIEPGVYAGNPAKKIR